MQRITHELMLDHVRAIYQALTGADLPSIEGHAPLPPGEEAEALVTSRFAEVETSARFLSTVAGRVPPFAFCPLVDVVERKNEITVEVSLPGVPREAVDVRVAGDMLFIEGVREWDVGANGHAHRTAEIPRGPFRRVILLPPSAAGEPKRVESHDGILRITLAKASMAPVAKA